MTLLYITCKDEKEAVNISKHLLEKRLIACSNMFPIKSMYWWQGKIENGSEVVIIAKTNNKNFAKAEREIKKLHSYKIPCILRIDAKANKEYADWAEQELR